jgi:hypothetical protein
MIRIAVALALVACSSKKERPAPAPPPPADAAVADATVVIAESEPQGPQLDACDQVYIDATATPRTLLFSCLGVAIDLPKGLSASGGPRDLSGVVVEIVSLGAADDGEIAIAGHIDGSRAEFEPSFELSSPEAETTIQIDGDELRGTAVGPAKTTKNRVYRVFREDKRSGLRGSVVTADGLHTLRFNFIGQLSPSQLENRLLPLMKVRPMTAAEIKLAPLPEDMTPMLVDRVLPLEKDGSKHELVLCKNGTYRLSAPVGDLAQNGTWRMSLNTLWISHAQFLADGVYHVADGIRIGMFGTTTTKPPFAPAAGRCPAK